jgi:predicted O-methyltransferase YrrM
LRSIHGRSLPERLLHSCTKNVLGSLHRPGAVLKFVKGALKYPVDYEASQAVGATPEVSLEEFLPSAAEDAITVEPRSLRRHAWNVGLHEEIYIGLAVRALNAKRIFEIGTFNGETTRYMSEVSAPDARIFTLDLPPREFDRDQRPTGFSGSRVGEVYKGSASSGKVTQLLEDSTTFDFSPYAGSIDFVFVDAAHDYLHGRADSITALKIVRPGGVIFWHDYTPYWSGLVHGIREATLGLPLKRLRATSLAVLKLE